MFSLKQRVVRVNMKAGAGHGVAHGLIYSNLELGIGGSIFPNYIQGGCLGLKVQIPFISGMVWMRCSHPLEHISFIDYPPSLPYSMHLKLQCSGTVFIMVDGSTKMSTASMACCTLVPAFFMGSQCFSAMWMLVVGNIWSKLCHSWWLVRFKLVQISTKSSNFNSNGILMRKANASNTVCK